MLVEVTACTISSCCVVSKCQSSGVLPLVDNYALVCLDICWCYLCLQNMSSLPDAGQSVTIVVVVVLVVVVVVVVVVDNYALVCLDMW